MPRNTHSPFHTASVMEPKYFVVGHKDLEGQSKGFRSLEPDPGSFSLSTCAQEAQSRRQLLPCLYPSSPFYRPAVLELL